MTEFGGHNTASIAQGAQLLMGAPATALPVERLQTLREALATVPGVAEAHLPLVFARELGNTPQLFLAVFQAKEHRRATFRHESLRPWVRTLGRPSSLSSS
jgi:hypothetical protein